MSAVVMAICFRRIFKTYRSFSFMVRNNRHTGTCPAHKKPGYMVPILKEISTGKITPLTLSCNCNLHKEVGATVRFYPKSSISDYCVKNSLFDYSEKFRLSSIENKSFEYCVKECKAYREEVQNESGTPGRPDPEQVLHVFKVLSEDLPHLFKKNLNFKIYHPNLVFENNIRGTTTIGIFGYINQIALLRTVGHIKFSRVNFEILKITAHPEDGTVRIRWRIRGIPNYKAFISFFKIASPQSKIDELEGWYDGFSIYYVRSDGLVHKHIVDKVIPDSEEKTLNIHNHLAAKIALALGIIMDDPYSIVSLPHVGYVEETSYQQFCPIICKSCLSEEIDFNIHFQITNSTSKMLK